MPPTQAPFRPCRPTRVGRWLALLCALLFTVLHAAEDSSRRRFDLPSGAAVVTLKRAAQQAGLEIVYSAAVVEGVQTQPVAGEFTPREALERMVANTPLKLFPDPRTGALSVLRTPDSTPHTNPPEKNVTSPMIPRSLLAVLAGLFTASNIVDAQTAAPPSGTAADAASLSGTVSNSATGNLLEGSRVELPSLARSTLKTPPSRRIFA